jgi:hypothetical protein
MVNASTIQHIQGIFRDGFSNEKDWPEERIRERLNAASVIGLLKVGDAAPCGYAIYSSPDRALGGKFVLWEDSICLRQALQGKGLSPRPRQLVRELSTLLGREFGWLGGDTQNPVVYKRYKSLGRVFPIDAAFTGEPGQGLFQFLEDHVPQVKTRKKYLDKKNKESGVLKKIYTEGRLGQYTIDVAGAEPFEEYLTQYNVSRENGDALLLVAEIRE